MTVLVTPLVFVYGLHWSDPYKSSLVGSIILKYGPIGIIQEGTKSKSFGTMSIKILLLLFNHYVWVVGLYGFGLFVNWFHVLAIFVLRFSLKKFLRSCLKVGNPFPIARDTLVYREIQVLSILNNAINQGVVLFVTTGAIFLLAQSLTAIIKLEWRLENVLVVSLFGMIFMDGVMFLLVCVGGMVAPNVISKQVLEALTRRCAQNGIGRLGGRYCYKWLQLYIKSCWTIKVKIGKDNFLEELTPLICVNLAITLAVNMLLLTCPHKQL
ncbi:unnamed protein product [Orchesella dallaii]|uniref:Uncharacterized protein n=1 Tax=Orchesella dallaii TaxID=48710 RepID=A0ABP1S897_9HEXA